MGLSGLTATLSKLVPAVVFLLASTRFFLTGGYHLTGGTATGRTVLPLGRRGKGKVAVTGSLLEQVKDVTTEPGVREQL